MSWIHICAIKQQKLTVVLSICMQNQLQNEANFFFLGIQILPVATNSITRIKKQQHIILHLCVLHLHPSTGMHVPTNAAWMLRASECCVDSKPIATPPWHCCSRQIVVLLEGKTFRKRCSSWSISSCTNKTLNNNERLSIKH